MLEANAEGEGHGYCSHEKVVIFLFLLRGWCRLGGLGGEEEGIIDKEPCFFGSGKSGTDFLLGVGKEEGGGLGLDLGPPCSYCFTSFLLLLPYFMSGREEKRIRGEGGGVI